MRKIEKLIPRKEWIGIIKPIYYEGEIGNKPYDLEPMLRIIILQNLYYLADMKAMYEVIDNRTFSDFYGVDSPNQVLNGDTIGRFRDLLENNKIQEKLFEEATGNLMRNGLRLKRGTIVDFTLIAAPTSTKNAKNKKIPKLTLLKMKAMTL